MSSGPDVVKAWPDGHYYSPIPDLDEVRRRAETIFANREDMPGIDLGLTRQDALLPVLAREAAAAPFAAGPSDQWRYQYDNLYFGPGDALVWFGLLRLWRPNRVVEVGSGWSSAVLLDAVEMTPDWEPRLAFVEPYPERLQELLRPEDSVDLHQEFAQDVPWEVFTDLAKGDVLFIDSTHVSRVGSDVNFLLLEVLPSLKKGVRIHIHDILYPFEYPAEWVYEGRAWNEAYMLRALLTGSSMFQITWWNSAMATLRREQTVAAMPLWGRNPGGSIYLERV